MNRDALIEQIARDMVTLKLPLDLIAPDREFYVERIAMYREALGASATFVAPRSAVDAPVAVESPDDSWFRA